MNEAFIGYLTAHQDDFKFHATEIPYNPYLRGGNGNQYHWHVVITYAPTKAQFKCHFSSDENVINSALVLDVVRSEILMLNECASAEEYATKIGLPQNDAMDARDVRHVHRTALRHRDEFMEAFGPDVAAQLLGQTEAPADPEPKPKPVQDDGLGFW